MSDNPLNSGPWEVEQKFLLEDTAGLNQRLIGLGANPPEIQRQVDTYYRHPCRDFRSTDEAFRIRVVNNQACITYKGRRLPGPVKTRPEIEVEIQAAQLDAWRTMLTHLGFVPAGEVCKERHAFQLLHRGQNFAVAIDRVAGLGDFVELELVVSASQSLDTARESIQQLAAELGLTQVQSRSYLSLVLEQSGELQ